jgi:plasmid maintenance system antidote protein VapI
MNVSKLLDTLRERFQIKNDAALARELELSPAVISKLRNGKLPLASRVILRIHEYLGVPVKEIRELAA